MNKLAHVFAWSVVIVGFLVSGALLLAIIGLILSFYGYAWLWNRCWEWLKQQKKVKV